jgi:hypothetical protein
MKRQLSRKQDVRQPGKRGQLEKARKTPHLRLVANTDPIPAAPPAASRADASGDREYQLTLERLRAAVSEYKMENDCSESVVAEMCGLSSSTLNSQLNGPTKLTWIVIWSLYRGIGLNVDYLLNRMSPRFVREVEVPESLRKANAGNREKRK